MATGKQFFHWTLLSHLTLCKHITYKSQHYVHEFFVRAEQIYEFYYFAAEPGIFRLSPPPGYPDCMNLALPAGYCKLTRFVIMLFAFTPVRQAFAIRS